MTEQLNILALDTSCGAIAACILKDGQSHLLPFDDDCNGKNGSGKTRSTSIVPALDSLLSQAGLDWQQLDALALGAGPGSFTGLRIAAATLAGINAGLQLPIIHLSSLAITAGQSGSGEAIWVLEDARAGQVFVGRYGHAQAMPPESCLQWQDITALEPGLFCCHSQPAVTLDGWRRLPISIDRSEALAVELKACLPDIASLQGLTTYPAPLYLQLSQAERNAHAQQ